MSEQPAIYKAMANIMGKITHIAKEKKNTQQGFMYRGIDDVMNELHSLFAEERIFIVPITKELKQDEKASAKGGTLYFSKITVQYDFVAEDGSKVSSTVIGEAMDSGDKSTNKALSVALKYALLQIFLIPTQEMKDPDAETQPETKPIKKPEPQKETDEQIQKRIDMAIVEMKDCRDLADLQRVWSKHNDLQRYANFSTFKESMKANINKNFNK